MPKPYIIGIAGGSASGKTTFSDALASALDTLNVKIIHMDGYFKPADQRPHTAAPITGKVYTDDNHPETVDLPQLKRDLAADIAAGACDVLIVEGLLTLWDEDICARLDLKLFVECRTDERIVRRLKRNMTYGLSFDGIAGVYLDMVRYRHDEYVEPSKWKADFILNGSNPSETALGMVAQAVRLSVERR